ncbi:F-BAR domain only protein 2-like isoform X2 [Dendronephthya gigantea]|uniref:F-BAR domain only protein 2-like isoform X2 n=1 Tax=Dendronephthya gigantea TaxID=151771 RepID=UPI00106D9235|nr:F-BAR domain only protein 2-like isoform X2 [Dendronephthya gigantea]
MVYFEDNFWGEKNNGYDVLYHTMKHGINASRELADFIRDRAAIEEGYAKSLGKICKATNTGISLGTFEPCWNIVKKSTEILANSFSKAVQELHDLMKVIRDYGELQKENQKSLKDDLNATLEVVQSIQTKTAAVIKAKDTYYSRCQEFERVKKETTNAKDIEKAEQKKIRAGEEYKSLVEKREEVRKLFHAKMIETSKKFEEIEMNHLKCMSEHLISYIGTLEKGQGEVHEVIAHFRTQVKELTSDKLLDQFVKDKGTGKIVPVEIFFEEFAATGSLVDLGIEESPNLNNRSQSVSDKTSKAPFRKKKKEKDKEKDKEKKEKKPKRKKEKEKLQTPNGTIEASPDTNPPEALPGSDDKVEVDEEGYRIIPKDTDSHKSNESSSSDSDDDDEPKKIKITIKPPAEKTTASLDEFRSIQLTLPIPPQKKTEPLSADGDFPKSTFLNGSSVQSSVKLSKSQEDLLSIDFSQPAISSASVIPTSPTTTPTSSSQPNQHPNASTINSPSTNSAPADSDDNPPELAPKKRISGISINHSNESSPALPPKKSTLAMASFGSTGSLTDTSTHTEKEADESIQSPPETLSFLAPRRSDIPRATSAGSLNIPASRPRPKPRLSGTGNELSSGALSLKQNFDPTRTYASPTPSTESLPTTSADVYARISGAAEDPGGPTKTIWDRINSPSTQRAARGSTSPVVSVRGMGSILQPTMVNASAGSQVTKKNEEIIPVAVALVETVHAHFKGKDTSRHSVTGDVTVSFPASAITSLSSRDEPPVLTFAITGSGLLENVLPNKSLIASDEPAEDRDAKYFKFKMPALTAHLKKLAEQGQAPYYNIDILKYQVQHNIPLLPLALSCYWKCEEKTTDVRLDYQYSPSCLSVASPLHNVSVVVPVNGGVEIMQSKPMAKWSKEHNKALWQIQELSNNSEGQGSNSLRARFDLKDGPSTAQTIAVQFQCNGSTLSKIDFQLNTDNYKLSLVKRKIVTGKYMADPR